MNAEVEPVEVAAELRRFTELGTAQLQAALRESDRCVDELAGALGSLVADAHELEQLAGTHAEGEQHLTTRLRIQMLAASLNEQANTVVTALQFYDNLVRRLMQVREGYGLAQERVLFDLLTRGLSTEQMREALTSLRAADGGGEFEAF